MQVDRYATAADFLAAAEPFLLRAEVENNLILGIAHRLATETPGEGIAPYLATVRDGDAICMAAFRTIAIRAGVTRALRPEAIEPLLADVADACPEVREIIGPEPTAGDVASGLAAIRGLQSRRRMAQRMYELRAVEPLDGLPKGQLRFAQQSEAAILTEWVRAFLVDIGDRGDATEVVRDRLARDQLYVWDDGGPVSMAAWTGKTPTGVRVNLVYTPPPLRGRGYATATVAALSRLLLDQGNHYCCLYTDLTNATSHAIYSRIGYRPVSEAGAYVLADQVYLNVPSLGPRVLLSICLMAPRW